MSSKRPPARLFVLLAREKPTGVIFRRGPTKWVQLVSWNTATDEFQPGQWFNGRIYEKRCDLSPDGSRLIYFAQKYSGRSIEDTQGFLAELLQVPVPLVSSHYTCTWTAISKPPYFTALALWPKGNSYSGGGLFETNQRVCLNHGVGWDRPHVNHQPRGLVIDVDPNAHGEDDPLHHRRLLRDGWQRLREWEGHIEWGSMAQVLQECSAEGMPTEAVLAKLVSAEAVPLTAGTGFVTKTTGLWAKANEDAQSTLWMQESLWGFEKKYEFSVSAAPETPRWPLDGASWAEWDQVGRLVYARRGKISAGTLSPSGVIPHELVDLNSGEPETVEAPEAYATW